MIDYRIPVGATLESVIDFLVVHCSGATRAFSAVTDAALSVLEHGLAFIPWWLFIPAVALLTWRGTGSRGLGLFALLGLGLVYNMGLWPATVSTIALVLVATLLAVLIGLPLGVFAAINKVAYRAIMPVLDVMQTMPAFVYLIPAIPFFGLGKVAAIFSTVVFAMPPVIRLTCLGIRQVPVELVECAEAFGTNRWQRLRKLELPLAAPTIMAGVNQTVMLALSMVVIAAMIGAKGLGGEVWKAIQRLEMGRGFEAGIGIVIVAICLDRLLQKIGSRSARR
ncbi:ABC-type transporter, integral membrane subunit [Oleidesulfovibrio alaskensis G20]|jgi:glycine betaine/proline transport system permease protein|uniref:ABC-type transporter, integral membrane subunit n=1 Tax=Oleidesulfovibrio alaskensis (strain ATCC BAA-1058 / DSM 17464 / G20) TaxID=207559 RepID=Q315C1_OLEA2|nr:proline/glycine betaine ABC transporter permease [Oleidesulfovibrio alaskensis]ABB37475.1 ABC-type transporter, integral membrane subunit [Oleidesulfovibrio alaskensis G20]MBG0774662.1 proline/glycine betaine ABC transporter permease [Oleidesulfovibrio alaskensis]MBL3581429.1 proline/glycine betaine ABC transporter permease [Oleidesulfovibrio alaskensis]